jgi:hypothetical protein
MSRVKPGEATTTTTHRDRRDDEVDDHDADKGERMKVITYGQSAWYEPW